MFLRKSSAAYKQMGTAIWKARKPSIASRSKISVLHQSRPEDCPIESFSQANARYEVTLDFGKRDLGEINYCSCQWAKDSIVVMDEVIISSPYEPDNGKAKPSSSATLARVKKVVRNPR
jgi:hypothetical protein